MRGALMRQQWRQNLCPPTTTTTTKMTYLVTNERGYTGIYLSDTATRLIGGKYGGDVVPRKADVQTTDVSTSGGYTRNRHTAKGLSWPPRKGPICLQTPAPYSLGHSRPTWLSIDKTSGLISRFYLFRYSAFYKV